MILPPPLCESKAIAAAFAAEGVPVVALATGTRARRRVLRAHRRLPCRARDDRAPDRAGPHAHRASSRASRRRPRARSASRASRPRWKKRASRSIPRSCVQGFFSYKSGLEAAEKLLARKRLPTAIFASNDDMAAAAISVAHRRGLDVPQRSVGRRLRRHADRHHGLARAHHDPPAHRRDGGGGDQPAAAQDPASEGSARAPGGRSPRALCAREARFGRAAAQALNKAKPATIRIAGAIFRASACYLIPLSLRFRDR